MKLFLASEAKHPNSISMLREFIGGYKGKKIAYIPTAANGEDGWGSWVNGGSWQTVNKLGAKITLVQLEEQREKDIEKVLKGHDILWFAGGYSGYLMYWIKSTGLDRALLSILNQGTVYVGSSAGAMITGMTLDVSTWYIGGNDLGAVSMSGLGLVDFDIYPHYEEALHDEIQSKFTGEKLYLLKNGEEIIIDDGVLRVIGKERVISR